jgi:hypothetical protein
MRERMLSQLVVYDGQRIGELIRVTSTDGLTDLGFYSWDGNAWVQEDGLGTGDLDTTGAAIGDIPQFDGTSIVWMRFPYA